MHVFLNFLILSRCLVNGLQALEVNPGCLRCNSGTNLSPVNNNLLIMLFILIFLKSFRRYEDFPLQY